MKCMHGLYSSQIKPDVFCLLAVICRHNGLLVQAAVLMEALL